jgi:hypothetical protein
VQALNNPSIKLEFNVPLLQLEHYILFPFIFKQHLTIDKHAKSTVTYQDVC